MIATTRWTIIQHTRRSGLALTANREVLGIAEVAYLAVPTDPLSQLIQCLRVATGLTHPSMEYIYSTQDREELVLNVDPLAQ